MGLANAASLLQNSDYCSPPSLGTGGGFASDPPLRAAVVIDYENMQRVAMSLFHPNSPTFTRRLHPGRLVEQLVLVRNSAQRDGLRPAVVQEAIAFRGMPSSNRQPRAHAKFMADIDRWRRDGVNILLRPLKYEKIQQCDRQYSWVAREKGIDVLCALAVVRLGRRDDIDLVILASHDSDLAPALDGVLVSGFAKIETVSWRDEAVRRFQQLRPTHGEIWNTRLGRDIFNMASD